MIKVKICGITNLEDALFCSKFGVDALGFIFTKKSPRYISEKEAKKIIDKLDPYITKVGVFVDEVKEKVLEIAEKLNLSVLQFHGKESPQYCNFFKPKFKIVKTLFLEDRPFIKKISTYKVDAFLFDIKYEDKIKGKKTLPKEILKEISYIIKMNKLVIISGGLNPYNVLKIKKINPYAVDVASGVEKFIGKKDKELVHLFIKNVKSNETP